MFDPKAPDGLKKTLQWFGSIIARPIDLQSRMNSISPSGNPMEEEACRYIVPSFTLKAHQRMEIYNQQYWWRLLSALHESFPFLTRLFGYKDFNQEIGIPYLEACPPDTWTLSLLGARLPDWIANHYLKEDKKLVEAVAEIDWAFNYHFIAEKKSPPDPNDPQILTRKLFLQPHVTLFALDDDLFWMRNKFLERDVEWWQTNPFPDPPNVGPCSFVLYRNFENQVVEKKVDEEEFCALTRVLTGCSIESLLESAEGERVPAWLQRWMALGWLC
jgi:hypothetical protein